MEFNCDQFRPNINSNVLNFTNKNILNRQDWKNQLKFCNSSRISSQSNAFCLAPFFQSLNNWYTWGLSHWSFSANAEGDLFATIHGHRLGWAQSAIVWLAIKFYSLFLIIFATIWWKILTCWFSRYGLSFFLSSGEYAIIRLMLRHHGGSRIISPIRKILPQPNSYRNQAFDI